MKKEMGIYIGWCIKSPSDKDSNQKYKDLIKYIDDHSCDNLKENLEGDFHGITHDEEGDRTIFYNSADWGFYEIDKAWGIIFNDEEPSKPSEPNDVIPTQKPLI